MSAASNFTVKMTLDEANDAREAHQLLLDTLQRMPIAEMTEAQKEQVGRLRATLARDYKG
jgi:hypothetical protein